MKKTSASADNKSIDSVTSNGRVSTRGRTKPLVKPARPKPAEAASAITPAVARPASKTSGRLKNAKKPAKTMLPQSFAIGASVTEDAVRPVAADLNVPIGLDTGFPAASKSVDQRHFASQQKTRKIKLVRDSFAMPEAEHAVLGAVKKSCLAAGTAVKKSELFRIGVALLARLSTEELLSHRAQLVPLKTGRPKSA